VNVFANWTPPENPDPFQILHEARTDTSAGRVEIALAKHVWYHDNALKIQPSNYGVRLSFALGYWCQLGQVYPPALDKLKNIRDECERVIRASEGSHSTFAEFASINRMLNDQPRTKELFIWLDNEKPGLAKQVFSMARSSLIVAGDYELCGRYLDSNRTFGEIVNLFHATTSKTRDPKRDLVRNTHA